MPKTIVTQQGQMFVLKAKRYQDPAFVKKASGQTKIQGMFTLMPVGAQGNLTRAGVLILDISYSMESGGAIEALRNAVVSYLDQIPEGDEIGVIVFSGRGQSSWLEQPHKLTAASRKRMQDRIKKTSTISMTCFGEPLKMGLDHLASVKADLKSVDFFTDGHPTEGPRRVSDNGNQNMQDEDEAIWRITEAAALGVQFNLYAMGTGYNVDLMSKMTQVSKGRFYHITANGDGLADMMSANALRFGKAVAANVTVEIRLAPGFVFGMDPDDPEQKLWVFRKSGQLIRLTPIMSNTMVVDNEIGAVNEVEGIAYDFIVDGTQTIPPTGDVWEGPLASMTVIYTVAGVQYEQTVDLTQSFTTDFGKVATDRSVADTMTQTRSSAVAAEVLEQISMARTMGDTAAMQQLSLVLTQISEKLGKAAGGAANSQNQSRLLRLSVSIADAAGGIGDDDSTRGQATMLRSMSLEDLTGGMGDA